ncbi:helix-turn-helix domain-containing protein [Planococcus sp. APC 4015]|nr:helix-turn-helix domain-containing protein [Planococcus sp. APC 4015]
MTLDDVEEDTVTHASATEEQNFVPVKSADRTLEVLECLAAGAASLAELSARLQIPKSSLHSILRTLERRGWVEADGSRSHYRLGASARLFAASHSPSRPVGA